MKPLPLLTKTQSDKLVEALEQMGWSPCKGQRRSSEGFAGEKVGALVGYTVGVLVDAGDPRFQWAQSMHRPEEMSPTAALANFFANSHKIDQKPHPSMQPVGFSWEKMGASTYQLSSLSDTEKSIQAFVKALQGVSKVNGQNMLFDPSESSDVIMTAERRELLQRVQKASADIENSIARRDRGVQLGMDF